MYYQPMSNSAAQTPLMNCDMDTTSGRGGADPGDIGEALRSARKRAGLSTQEAANRAGISVPLLGLIERGNHPLTNVSTRNLARLNLAFGLSWAEFVQIILPVYADQLPYLSVATPVSSRYLNAPGNVKEGLSPACQNGHVTQTINVPDFAAIAAYPDADLIVLHVTADSLSCEEARNAVPVDCHAIFNIKLLPMPGDVVAVWLDAEGCGALQVWVQDGKAVVLNSYNTRERPVITERPTKIRGVYVGHLSSGRRSQVAPRMQH